MAEPIPVAGLAQVGLGLLHRPPIEALLVAVVVGTLVQTVALAQVDE